MARKRRTRETSIRRDPRLTGETGFSFDNEDEIPLDLTPEEEADAFMSRYQEVVHPLTKFKKFFETSALSIQHIFLLVKRDYVKYVLSGQWDERKFVMVINDIFEMNKPYTPFSLDISSRLYEEGRLASQRRAEDRRKRRRL